MTKHTNTDIQTADMLRSAPCKPTNDGENLTFCTSIGRGDIACTSSVIVSVIIAQIGPLAQLAAHAVMMLAAASATADQHAAEPLPGITMR